VKTLITDWWENKTTISPNKKDVVKRLLGIRLFKAHATYYL
jgi:hypothetical protein